MPSAATCRPCPARAPPQVAGADLAGDRRGRAVGEEDAELHRRWRGPRRRRRGRPAGRCRGGRRWPSRRAGTAARRPARRTPARQPQDLPVVRVPEPAQRPVPRRVLSRQCRAGCRSQCPGRRQPVRSFSGPQPGHGFVQSHRSSAPVPGRVVHRCPQWCTRTAGSVHSVSTGVHRAIGASAALPYRSRGEPAETCPTRVGYMWGEAVRTASAEASRQGGRTGPVSVDELREHRGPG